jgi:hypothetical protein
VSPGEYVSDWVADLKKGLNSLYMYCPLVEPRMVGDAQVPLLRIVPVEGKRTADELIIFFHFHIDFMIDFIEIDVEFILEFLHVPFPLDRESFWPLYCLSFGLQLLITSVISTSVSSKSVFLILLHVSVKLDVSSSVLSEKIVQKFSL